MRSSRPICPRKKNSRLELFSVLARGSSGSGINTRGETLAITVVRIQFASPNALSCVARFSHFSGRVKWRSVFPRSRLGFYRDSGADSGIHRQKKKIFHTSENVRQYFCTICDRARIISAFSRRERRNRINILI